MASPSLASLVVYYQQRRGTMSTRETIIKYYNELDRSYFMDIHKERAHEDRPFPIGHEQTISQPSLVLEMTILLNITPLSKVLEIGTGSGYQTALLAKAAKTVYTVERIEKLHLTAIEKLTKAGYSNISYKLGDGSLGWQEHAPFDRIMVTASATKMPGALIEQLAPNGKMVIPVGPGFVQELLLVEKDPSGKIHKKTISQVRFVRLVGDY